jgi:hypothetical protein
MRQWEMSMSTRRLEAAWVVWVALVATVPCTGSAAPGADAGVGVVAEYRPASGRFTLVRAPGGDSIPVQIGAVVVAGDKVTLPAGASLTLQLSSGERADFKGPGTFSVPDARPLGKLAAVFQSLSRVFDDEYRLSGTAASRGGEDCGQGGRDVAPIDVPILAPGAKVVAGERDIPLAWRGGCPPFAVAVVAEGGRVVRRESIEGWQVRLDAVPLTPGRYAIAIAGATGQRYEGSLVAVPTGPAIPPDLVADTTPLGITAQAMWLAGQDEGRWRLDSFEKLRPLIRAGDPLAGSLGDGLLWGSTAQARR